ncbi:MAG: cell division protein SepF [Vallitaleaceae bacterium]|nr:cell division protein SepF [Vallitaleaceae bacterium]
MAGIFDKIIDLMNLNEYEDDDQESEELDEEIDALDDYSDKRQFKSYSGGKTQASSYAAPNNAKVLNLQTSIQMEVHVIQPSDYNDACEICNYLIQHKPVIINLEKLDAGVAQRIMDFISGSCYTLEGNVQKVTNNIFIIAPANVDVAGNFKEELKSNGIILPWKGE